MKKSKLALLLGALLSLFVLAGCPGPAGGSSETVTVTFNDNGKVSKTVTLASGSSLSSLRSYELPSDPYKSYNYFMYWSESKESQAKAVEFDYNTPITENKTLYAIYTPSLDYISCLTNKQIQIKLSTTTLYPLDDGSYAGIKFLHSTDGINYTDFNLSKHDKAIDYSNRKYLTYNFPTQLEAGKHYFKVTNDKESFNSTITISENDKFITFDDAGLISSVKVATGETITKPSDPYQSYNYFMYWSESKESQAKAVEFDFATPVTEDKTLYAIYSPKIYNPSSSNKQVITKSSIEITLYDTHVYPLDDGSYAGIKFEIGPDIAGPDFEDLHLSIPESTKDFGGYRYLTYKFNPELTAGTHYIKVSNPESSYMYAITVFNDPRTITFNDNGKIIKTVEVESGTAMSVSQKPSNPSKSFNTFMYWSESKASQAEAVEFNFGTPISENKTLYAIYSPNIWLIDSITRTQIKVKLEDDSVFPLEDGSYAGVRVLYSANGSNYTDLGLSIPSEVQDLSGYRYLTYTFDTTFNDGNHYFKVTYGLNKSVSKNIFFASPTPVTNLTAAVDDSYADVSFTTVDGFTSYTVSVYKNSNTNTALASKTITASSSTTKNVEFFGLENGTEYTFKVLTDGTDKFAEVTATPEIKQKETDWLLVMYMDGDNNLNDPIYLDLNEAENGLAQNSNRNNIKVVALWDGWDFESGNKDGETSFFDQVPSTYKIDTEATLLLELGPDSNTFYGSDDIIYWKGCELSSVTKNLSYTAPWIVSNKTVTTKEPTSSGEVNMGDVQTLTNYLNWVRAHYKANKGIILQFSNHGGGPRSITLKNNFGRRSMCWDETSGGEGFLKTSDVSKALKDAGFGTSNKVKMIMEDVCLGGSLEEAYELKDYAEYYVGSPNNIPARGFDYIAFVSSLTSTATIEEIGGKLIKSYKNDYTWTTSDWNKFLSANQALNDSEVNEFIKSVFNSSLSTLSFIDLSKIEAVKNAVEEYATLVKSASEEDELLKVDSNGNHYLVGQSSNIPDNATFVSINEAIKYHTALYGDPLYYKGTFGTLKDLGFMSFYLNTTYDETSNSTWINILSKANAITDALNNAIIACWRDGYNKPTYYKNPQDSSNSGLADSWYGNSMGFGLTINCSCWVPHTGADGKTYLYEDFAEWYSNELAFGKDCSAWTNLIKDWFKK